MKLLRMCVTLLSIAATAMLWSGCSTQALNWDRPTIYDEQGYLTRPEAGRADQTEVPIYNRAPEPKPTVKPVAGCGPSAFMLKSDLLNLQKQVPAQAFLGQTVESTLTIHALDNCAAVVINDTVPDGATFVKSEPAATVTGQKLTWMMDTLDKGSQIIVKVWYKVDQEGCLATCASMAAIPRGCARTLVGSAKLMVTCQLPASAGIGAALTKTIEVKNIGSAVAEHVIVTDTLPAGLTTTGETTFDVGDIAPGQSKQISVPLTAAKRGSADNAVVAKAANAVAVTSRCATVINQPGLAIAKSGTKEQFLGRNASYDIVVNNTGDTDLQAVMVTDTAPAATRIVSASGAKITGNTAMWTIDQLRSGAKQTFNLVLTSAISGSHCNEVMADTTDGLTAKAQACTLWKGVPAILLETRDDPDPVGIGETVVYTIRVTNQGTADDTNVKVVADFEKEVDPVSTPSGTINGKTVTFPVIASLAAKQVVTYTITAKGVSAGDHRLKVSLTSDILTSPVTHEESTHVY